MLAKNFVLSLALLVGFWASTGREVYAQDDVFIRVTEPSASGTGTIIEVGLPKLKANNAAFFVNGPVLHYIVNGHYNYVVFDQTLPLDLRISDSNFDSSIHLGGYTPIAGFEYNIVGSGGDDSITMQLTGDGTMRGGPGNDVLQGGPGNENLIGNEGDDIIRGGAGNDVLEGWSGVDFIYGEGGEDILYGDEDSDFLFGGEGRDEVIGGGGDDTLIGSDPVDHNGQDPITSADGEFDELWGETGADNFVYSFYDWVGSGFFKRRKEREFDLLMDYNPDQGDNLLQAEIATVDITSIFR